MNLQGWLVHFTVYGWYCLYYGDRQTVLYEISCGAKPLQKCTAEVVLLCINSDSVTVYVFRYMTNQCLMIVECSVIWIVALLYIQNDCNDLVAILPVTSSGACCCKTQRQCSSLVASTVKHSVSD